MEDVEQVGWDAEGFVIPRLSCGKCMSVGRRVVDSFSTRSGV